MRNSPTPAAPRSRQAATSPPNSILPQSSIAAAVEGLGGQVGLAGQDLEPGRPLGGEPADSAPGSAASGSRMTRPSSPSMMADPAMPGAVEEPAQPDHRRDLQRGGDDRRVAGAAAGLGGEARDAPRVEPGGLARASGRAPARSSAPPARRWNGSGRSPIKWPRIRASMSRTSAARAARCEPASRSSRDGVALEHLEHGVLGRDPLAAR